MAGRNISATHVALGSVRVQATTAIMGQAAGTAAAIALSRQMSVKDVPRHAIEEVQQQLLKDGCFLPNAVNNDEHDLARTAHVSAPSEAVNLGASPGDRWIDGGLREAGRQMPQHLTALRGQWIPVETGPAAPGLRTVSVLLRNGTDTPVSIPARLHQVDHIWDYRVETGMVLAETELVAEPGEHWVSWDVKIDANSLKRTDPGGQYVRIDLAASPEVEWLRAGRILPGAVSA